MFSTLLDNLSSFAYHHQVIIGVIVGFCFICISWGIEKFLEHYVFYKNPLLGYLVSVVGGLLILWLIQHHLLHAI